jgi:hypothetical protein
MDEHNDLMAYVLDYPEQAALEIARLRETNTAPWMFVSFLAGVLIGLWFG